MHEPRPHAVGIPVVRATLDLCSTGRNPATANLTITVDEQVLKKARLRALEQGTSVNAILRQYLALYAGSASTHEQAAAYLVRLSEGTRSRRGRRRWTRDELHER